MNFEHLRLESHVKRPAWWRLLRQRAAHQLRAHPYLYVLRSIFVIAFICLLIVQAATGHQANPIFLGAGSLYCLLVLLGLTQPVNAKAEELRDWALEEQDHIAASALSGKTEEDLEKLLEYHMKYGHLEEADRISQRLLAVIDSGPQALADLNAETPADAEASAGQVISLNIKPAEPQVALQPQPQAASASGLPDWMQNGKDNAAEPAQAKDQTARGLEKLPDWMN